jgi:hypothetical protein
VELWGCEDRFPCSGGQRVARNGAAAEEVVGVWPGECGQARCDDGYCDAQVTSKGHQLLGAVAVGPAPRDAVGEFREDAAAMPSLLGGSEDGDQQLMGADADATIGYVRFPAPPTGDSHRQRRVRRGR